MASACLCRRLLLASLSHPPPFALSSVLSRFEAAPEAEHRFLRDFLHLLYRDCLPLRPLLRALMARFLVSFARNPRRDAAVAPVLEVRVWCKGAMLL